jgi:hypothetical protein
MKMYGGFEVISAPDRGEWSASRPGRFTPGDRATVIHRVEDCRIKMSVRRPQSDGCFLLFRQYLHAFFVFLIGVVGCGVQLGPLGTTATNMPIVPTPGDYDDGEIAGMVIGKGNRSTRGKSAPVPLCPP